MDTKPGYLTSEFYVTIVAQLAAWIAAIAGGLPEKYAVHVTAIATAAYAISRAIAKVGPALLLILSSLGTLRELKASGAALVNGSAAVAKLLMVLLLPSFLLLGGCAEVLPGNDPVVVNAERTTQLALDTFNGIEKAEYDAYPTLKQISPSNAAAVRTFVNSLRRNAPDWLTSARNATKAYKSNRSADNKATLQTALAVLQAAIDEAQKYLSQINAAQAKQAQFNARARDSLAQWRAELEGRAPSRPRTAQRPSLQVAVR